MREGLLALAVGTGLQVMAAIMEADVTAVCGPKGRHDPERTATRHGHGAGSVTLGGRRVPVTRPRMRAHDTRGGCGAAGAHGEAVARRVAAARPARRPPLDLRPPIAGPTTHPGSSRGPRLAACERDVVVKPGGSPGASPQNGARHHGFSIRPPVMLWP